MYVDVSYLNEIAGAGGAMVASIGLVDETGAEISSRKIEGETEDFEIDYSEDGIWRPSVDLTFTITAGTTVAGWRAYDDPSAGVELGGADLAEESYDNDGEYTLIASDTGFVHALQS